MNSCSVLKLQSFTIESKWMLIISYFQLTVLESLEKEGCFLCAANIHLYFHPTAKSIRLLQTAVSLRQLESVIKMYKDQVCLFL